MNVALRDALTDAGVTRAELARKVGVSGKTVDRWLSSPERAPHPGTRAAVGEVLGVGPEMLWPRAVRSTIKLGTDREIVASYPYRNACPTSLWASLIDGAKRRVTFAGYTNYFLWQDHPRVADRLRAKAQAGCQVRFVVGDPESDVTLRREQVEGVPLTVGTRIRITLDQLAKMGAVPGVEARFSDDHIALSVFMFDEQMLVTPHIANLLGHESPMLHLRRLEADGLYDRFAQHVDALWEGGRPVPGLAS
ncbi:hypothetical protein [Streptomyces sp. NPDC056387]|uniref:hypothetical protein n=1 Tax=Streptomyces sp. NPDC056387 TaxID=3345803 RepID=UPI0035E2B4DA